MVGNKIKYTCKNCGWTTAIREEWADLKPKRCMNKKCNTSFQKFKEALIVEVPSKQEAPVAEKKTRSRKNKNETTTIE